MKPELCPGGFEKCSMWEYKGGIKCGYALCKYWAGMRSEADFKSFYGQPPLNRMPPWAECKITSHEDKPTATKCPTCGRAYRKKRKAVSSGPTPLEEYIDKKKKEEEGRPYDDDLPW